VISCGKLASQLTKTVLNVTYTRLLPNKIIFQGAQKGKSREVRSPTANVLGAAAKTLGTQIIFLGAPGCWAPVRQQPCI